MKNNWLIVVTNTKLNERWVKDSNECTYTGKDEHFDWAVAICRSCSIFDYKMMAKKASETRTLKGNKYNTPGMLGKRINKMTGNQESELTSKVANVGGFFFI